MQTLTISLIVTVLNEVKTIQILLDALRKQSVLPHETILIDGGSSDGTFEWLKENSTKYRILNLQIISAIGNRSLSRNVGIAAAKNSWIAITDAGCIPHPDWLENLNKTAVEFLLKNKNQREVVVAGYYDAKPDTPFKEAVVPYALVMPDQVNAATFLPATRSVLLQKSVWQKVGGFNEKLSDNEDYDFARRIRALGTEQVVIIFAEKAKVTWLPRPTLKAFSWMIFRFARGDAEAGLWRPKVGLVFIRYFLGGGALISLLIIGRWQIMVLFFLTGSVIYSLWSIIKNHRYVPNGWYWLPVLQIIADREVMRGTLIGLKKRISTA